MYILHVTQKSYLPVTALKELQVSMKRDLYIYIYIYILHVTQKSYLPVATLNN